MSEFLFPDNTVLCNFAAIERLEILREVLGGRGRWTQSVAREARRSARWLPALQNIQLQGWLGEALRVTDAADAARIRRIRTAVFGGSDNRPLQHLGEAETCYVITHWAEFEDACWISDDRESLNYAREQGLHTAETLDMMQQAVKAGLITAQDGFDLMQKMQHEDRHPRMPRSVTELA